MKNRLMALVEEAAAKKDPGEFEIGDTVDVHVRILEHGFEYDGAVYASLSAVAKAITGSHCNGFLFFRLTRQEPNHD